MFEKIPFFIPKIYPNRVWHIPSEERKIYLTFDDGPIPEVTPWVLEQLQKFSARATFFCIGDNIQKYPELFQQVISQGQAVGNHTQDHLNGWQVPTEKYVANVLLAEVAIEEYLGRSGKWKVDSGRKKELNIEKRRERIEDSGKRIEDRGINFSIQNSEFNLNNKQQEIDTKQQTTNNKRQRPNPKQQTTDNKLFRPPYGKLTGKQAKVLRLQGYQLVMWDVLSRDYDARVSASRCLQYVLGNTIPGSIIVFHDSLKAKKNLQVVLPHVLRHFSNLGFTFEKLD